MLPVFADSKSNMEVLGATALACGMIAVGSCNGDVTSTILQTLMEKTEKDLKDTYARFLALGLGLTYLGIYSHLNFCIIKLNYYYNDTYSCVM